MGIASMNDDQYSDKETAERMEKALRRSLMTPPRPFTPKATKPKRKSKSKKTHSRA